MKMFPKCIVFCNDKSKAGEDAEDEWEMCLSDAFTDAFTDGNRSGDIGIQSDVEVRVYVLNINYGHNKELMEKCPLLEEYSQFVAVGREYSKRSCNGWHPDFVRGCEPCVHDGRNLYGAGESTWFIRNSLTEKRESKFFVFRS